MSAQWGKHEDPDRGDKDPKPPPFNPDGLPQPQDPPPDDKK